MGGGEPDTSGFELRAKKKDCFCKTDLLSEVWWEFGRYGEWVRPLSGGGFKRCFGAGRRRRPHFGRVGQNCGTGWPRIGSDSPTDRPTDNPRPTDRSTARPSVIRDPPHSWKPARHGSTSPKSGRTNIVSGQTQPAHDGSHSKFGRYQLASRAHLVDTASRLGGTGALRSGDLFAVPVVGKPISGTKSVVPGANISAPESVLVLPTTPLLFVGLVLLGPTYIVCPPAESASFGLRRRTRSDVATVQSTIRPPVPPPAGRPTARPSTGHPPARSSGRPAGRPSARATERPTARDRPTAHPPVRP